MNQQQKPMGKLSKAIMQKAGLLPRLKLGIRNADGHVISTGKHQVRLVSERQTIGSDYVTGKDIDTVTYIFEEAGEKKEYEAPMKNKQGTKPHYFILSMSEINEGEEVLLEMKKKGIKNYVSIQKLGTVEEHEADDLEDQSDGTETEA